MFKYHHSILPTVLNTLFLSNMSVHGHYTRQQNLLHVPISSPIMSKTVRVTGVAIYNHFASLLSMDMTYDSYKYNLKVFIREHGIDDIL